MPVVTDGLLRGCRIRPVGTTGDTTPSCVVIGDNGQLGIYNPQSERRTVFAYDKVFDENINQEAVRAHRSLVREGPRCAPGHFSHTLWLSLPHGARVPPPVLPRGARQTSGDACSAESKRIRCIQLPPICKTDRRRTAGSGFAVRPSHLFLCGRQHVRGVGVGWPASMASAHKARLPQHSPAGARLFPGQNRPSSGDYSVQ